jgi:RNA polymerase sigma factor for flagellar operon FliA
MADSNDSPSDYFELPLKEKVLVCKSKLFDSNMSWAKNIGLKMHTRSWIKGIEKNDFIHYALVGLLEAINLFDPTLNINFRVYAKYRIKGEILNNIYSYSDKSQAYLCYKKEIVEDRLSAHFLEDEQRDNHVQVIDSIIDLTIGILIEDSKRDHENLHYGGDFYNTKEISIFLEKILGVVNLLSERQQKIVHYHYFQSMKFVDISDLLGITKGRVCQLHQEIILVIRKKLKI